MILKIETTPEVGELVIQILARVELLAGIYQPGMMKVDATERDVDPRLKGPKIGAARTWYWAKLPTLADGTFDMKKVEETVRTNLEAVGAHTMNGIVYQDIVSATLKGEKETEPAIRARRMSKPGTTQGAVQKLFAMGFIDRAEIPKEA